MGAIADLLDQVRAAGNFNSDMGLAEKLGVKRQTLHAWRHDQAPIPDERIAQLCALAKLDGPEWMARVHADRAQSPAERALWSKMLVRLAAAAILIAPMSAGAADKSLKNQVVAAEKVPGMYIMLKPGWHRPCRILHTTASPLRV